MRSWCPWFLQYQGTFRGHGKLFSNLGNGGFRLRERRAVHHRAPIHAIVNVKRPGQDRPVLLNRGERRLGVQSRLVLRVGNSFS
jgi:hypothetical protein